MGGKTSRRLVVDASVAGAAGTTEHPVSSSSRSFLRELRHICHRVVMTTELRREWNRHASKLAKLWLASMVSKRKVVDVQIELGASQLETAIDGGEWSGKERAALRKDAHLVLAALQTDRVVVSNDEEARELFRSLYECDPGLERVAWVNPSRADENGIGWLRAGAKPEDARRL